MADRFSSKSIADSTELRTIICWPMAFMWMRSPGKYYKCVFFKVRMRVTVFLGPLQVRDPRCAGGDIKNVADDGQSPRTGRVPLPSISRNADNDECHETDGCQKERGTK